MKKIVSHEVAAVTTILILGVLSQSLLQPILPLYLTSIGISPEILGLMLSVGMLGMVIGESYWGWIADQVRLRLPMSVGTTVCGLVVLCFALTQDIPALFVILFLWGLTRSAIFGPGRGYIGARAPKMKKSTFLAIITVIMAASRTLGGFPSGFVVDNLGYHWSFYIAGAIAIMGSISVMTGLRKVPPVHQSSPTALSADADRFLSAGQRLNYWHLSPQFMVTFLQFVGVGVFMTFLPLLANQVLGIAATGVGILFTIRGLATMVLGIPMGVLADRRGKKVLMVLGLVVSAAGMAGMAFAETFAWLIVFVTFTSVGLAMFSPAALGLISDSVPPEQQGTVMGVYGGFGEDAGIIAGSSVGGFVWVILGPQPTFLMSAASAILGAMICFTFVRDKVSRNP